MDGFFDGFDGMEGLGEAEELEAAGDSLRQFIKACEESLLAVEFSGGAPPEPPEDITEELQAECAGLAKLVSAARGADFETVLASPLLEPLAKVLTREQVNAAIEAGGIAQLLADLRAASAEFIAGAPSDVGPGLRRLALLQLAVAAVQLYGHANWTGPAVKEFNGPFEITGDADVGLHGHAFLNALEVNGEDLYVLVRGPGYLWLACVLLGILPPRSTGSTDDCKEHEKAIIANGRTIAIWRGRCAFMWQLSLSDASERGHGQSPWLFKLCIDDLVGTQEKSGPLAQAGFLSVAMVAAVRGITAPVLNTWRDASGRLLAAPGAPTVVEPGEIPEVSLPTDSPSSATLCGSCPEVRAALMCEFCFRLCWYGRTTCLEDLLKDACAAIQFTFEVTGELGIKRQYQTQETAQMVVKTTSGAKKIKGVELLPPDEDQKAPQNFTLAEVDDMTDVLDRAKFTREMEQEERDQYEKPLTGVQQMILLTECMHIWVKGNPNDTLLLSFVNALAERVLVTYKKPEETTEGQMSTANWLTFSAGLFFRCRAEWHRNKTRERSTFQLQALCDQFNDEKPSPAHRVQLVHGAGYPARFHVQREMGVRMMKVGMVSTAFDQFKQLRMYTDAIDCLMCADRKAECLDLVNDLLEKQPTPRLWCALGDIETDRQLECYEKAWELSEQRNARAMRSLGRYHFTKNNTAKAVECFLKAVEINPLHSSIWFTCGVAQMKLERWDDAALSFCRCCGVDDENWEAWANLGAVHNERGDMKQARSCFYEASRRAREQWRVWESFMGICMKLRDIAGVINCMKRLIELEQGSRIQERVMGILTMSVVSDAQGLYKPPGGDETHGAQFGDKLMEFFQFCTQKVASVPHYWRFFAELQVAFNLNAEALESRLCQCRAAQARLWVEKDADVFGKELSDLLECFEALASALSDTELAAKSGLQQQPFAYSLRNAEKQLLAKIEACPTAPADWKEAHAKIDAMASKAEAQVAT